MWYTECNNPVDTVFLMILILEKDPDINEFARGDYHDSFVTQVYKLDGYGVIGTDLLKYFVVIYDIIKLLLNFLVSYNVFVDLVKAWELEGVKKDVGRG